MQGASSPSSEEWGAVWRVAFGLGGRGCSAHPAWRGWKRSAPWSGGGSARCAGSCRCTEMGGGVSGSTVPWTTGYPGMPHAGPCPRQAFWGLSCWPFLPPPTSLCSWGEPAQQGRTLTVTPKVWLVGLERG